VFFLIIALFAARHNVPARRFSATGKRHNVIHGQRFRRKNFAAKMAFARGDLLFPPASSAQLAGFLLFPRAVPRVFFNVDPIAKNSSFLTDFACRTR